MKKIPFEVGNRVKAVAFSTGAYVGEIGTVEEIKEDRNCPVRVFFGLYETKDGKTLRNSINLRVNELVLAQGA